MMYNVRLDYSITPIVFIILILNMNIFIWIFDNFIALIFFGSKIDLELGLPSELQGISVEKYQEVRGRVIAFKTSILFDKSVELVLTSDDINALYRELYLEYSKRPIKDKVFQRFSYFDIQDDEVIICEIFPFLFFPFNNSLTSKKNMKFTVQNGQIVQYRKFISMLNKMVYNSEYKLVPKKFSSGMINFILGFKTPDFQNSLELILEQIPTEASSTIKKLKSIRVINNKLILQS
jgi:hypothetical protein